MGSYREQYEKYYGNIRRHAGAAAYKSVDSYGENNVEAIDKKPGLLAKIIKRIIWQIFGSLILLIAAVSLKYLPIEGARKEYIQAKNMIQYDIDINNIIMHFEDFGEENYKEKVLECVDEVKSSVSGEKTLKELIREDYIIPVYGKIKYINGDSKGIAISVNNNENVLSVYGGTVEEIRDEGDNKSVVINHGNGTETCYELLSEVKVEEGAIVEKGETLGKCGDIDTTGKKGVIFKFIYLGNEKNPSDVMDLSSLEEG